MITRIADRVHLTFFFSLKSLGFFNKIFISISVVILVSRCNISIEVGEMLLALESVLEDAVKINIVSRQAAKYITQTMEEIAADHGYI